MLFRSNDRTTRSNLCESPGKAGGLPQLVKVIVALPAGGSVDMIAGSLGQKLNASLGQPFIIDNRAGASGQIGMPVVAKAAADGYTLTVSPASFLTTNTSIFKVLPYDPEADFAPVSRLP